MFDDKSRYLKAETCGVTDARGRAVTVVVPPAPPTAGLLGIHQLKEGERLDHLAARYLNDPAGFWRIAEQNDAMLPEALTGLWGFVDPPDVNPPDAASKPPEIEIPNPNS